MIPPAFDRVQPFTESGLAVVTAGGKPQIIDHKGAQVGKALDELVDDATLSDGIPARLSLTFNSVLLSPDGVRHVATDKMEVVEPFGPKDLFIAFDASKGYGIIDGNLTWRVLPQYTAITLDPQNSSVALAKNAEGITLIRTDGVPDEQKYLSVSEETGAFWLAKTPEGIKLLDLDLSASLGQLLLDVLSLSLGDLLLDSLGSAIDDSLSFLQAQTGDLLHQLDDLHLGSASLSQDDVELGLLFLSGSSSASSSGSSSSNSRNAELLADGINELFQLQDSHSLDRLDNGSDLLRSHGSYLHKFYSFKRRGLYSRSAAPVRSTC